MEVKNERGAAALQQVGPEAMMDLEVLMADTGIGSAVDATKERVWFVSDAKAVELLQACADGVLAAMAKQPVTPQQREAIERNARAVADAGGDVGLCPFVDGMARGAWVGALMVRKAQIAAKS